jgi:hypothetical protein
MRNRLHLPALIAISLLAATSSVFAQGAGAALGTAPGVGTNPPVGAQNPGSAGITTAPGGSSTTTTGMGSSTSVNPTHNQPGVPDTWTPGRFGTGALPSGLPGDDPAHPGFPREGRPIVDIGQRAAIKRRPLFARVWNQSERAKLDLRFR